MSAIRRIFVEKKKGYDVEASRLLCDLRQHLGISGLQGLRVLYRYDVSGISLADYRRARSTIFSEPPLDRAFDEAFPQGGGEIVFAIEYLPGQFDQRSDSAAQCVQLVTRNGRRPSVAAARVIVLEGAVLPAELERIKTYCINPVDSREAALAKPGTLEMTAVVPPDVPILEGFCRSDRDDLEKLRGELGLAMDLEDLLFSQGYFRDSESRDPTLTEIRMLDTYWSDHCRHTTFLTRLEEVEFEAGSMNDPAREAYGDYLRSRDSLYGSEKRDITLMDIARMGMSALRRRGKLEDLDVSDEINACSIEVPVRVDGKEEKWLVMFKNETHNHPTEIEPFGGAATCLGGAIRDPLSGRSWVYQAMRVTGSGDPRAPIGAALPGKLPQRKITTEAAQGYSAYGNQIGLATGLVAEIYDEGYVAKRMEIGAVIGAAPRGHVVRLVPQPGDLVLLVGGATGRDGIGGATGSSKAHTEESIRMCGAEVQKGNPVVERKIQRLFRRRDASRMIKRCNDFGAGGVSVAIGELADGVEIDLDAVPKKYEGLDGTELALSESQERMAVVVAPENLDRFRKMAGDENLDATPVARVTLERRLRMRWRGKIILNIGRDFLDSHGVERKNRALVSAPVESENFFRRLPEERMGKSTGLKEAWLRLLSDLNVCSQRGLVERFDASIGAGSIFSPFGGGFLSTPSESMIAKIPLVDGETSDGTVMSFGFSPRLARWSPFHGAVYAVIEAVARVVASGGSHRRIRLTLQEYFEKLGRDERKWGKPLAALLGAFYAEMKLGIPSIGGKDSMSGSFKDLAVPPTLVAFAVAMVDVRRVVSPEFKNSGSSVIYLPLMRDRHELPDFAALDRMYALVHRRIGEGRILAAHSVRGGGVAEAISRMCFGNRLGVDLEQKFAGADFFSPAYGSLLVEIGSAEDPAKLFSGSDCIRLGMTRCEPSIRVNGDEISLAEALDAWQKPLEDVFPTRAPAAPVEGSEPFSRPLYTLRSVLKLGKRVARPRALIAVFPGSNCEYDTERAFAGAGAVVETFVFKNLDAPAIEDSISMLAAKIVRSQILVIPGGFSAGDEPEGSGKFIAAVFRNLRIRNAIEKFLGEKDGLILGICNGFQALIKLGLVPDGHIRDQDERSPTLTFNTIGRHVARMARTRIVSVLSPWFSRCRPGDVHLLPLSHGEGRFTAPSERIEELFRRGQVAAQYVDSGGNPGVDGEHNPDGSDFAIEAVTSPDGRVLGKMGHSERTGPGLYVNVPGDQDQKIFEAGVAYFR